MVSAGGLVAFLAASLSFLAVMIWLSLRRRAQTGAEAGEITPEVCWHGDQFYYNPRDPALFVEKRIGLGIDVQFWQPYVVDCACPDAPDSSWAGVACIQAQEGIAEGTYSAEARHGAGYGPGVRPTQRHRAICC